MLFSSVRFHCVQEVAASSDPTQRFLELQSGQGWAFDKAMADRQVLMPVWNGKVFVSDVGYHSMGRAQASHFPHTQSSTTIKMDGNGTPPICARVANRNYICFIYFMKVTFTIGTNMQKKQVPCRWDLDIMFLELPFSPHIMSYSLTIYVFKFHFAVAVVKNDNVIANAHTGVCHIYIQVCTRTYTYIIC